jgi:hypothetical protein
MKKLRDALVLLLVSIAFGISLTLLARAVGFTSPLFVMVATCSVLGLTALARPWIVLKLPRPLQRVCAWETKGYLYRALGVPIFGTLLRDSPLHYLNSTVYLSRWPSDRAAVCAQMEAAEAAHLWAIALTIPYVLYAGIQSRWSTLFWIMIFNLEVNVYPVLHLRWVRGRLTRVRDGKLLNRSRTRPLTANAGSRIRMGGAGRGN